MKTSPHVWVASALCVIAALTACSGSQRPAEHSGSPATSPSHHWSYTGESGPAHWGSLDPSFSACGEGHAQSPVDFQGGLGATAGSTHSVTWEYAPGTATVVDNGHTLLVNVHGAGSITIDGVSYQLQQFHFHAPSEHTLGGEALAMEVHLVHRNANGELAVLGILINEGDANAFIASVWQHASSEVGHEVDAGTIDLRDFVPAAPVGYYRYEGSLTTPPCTEGVHWVVLRARQHASREQVARLTSLVGANARPVQELGARTIDTRVP